jgi:hypothetical protein
MAVAVNGGRAAPESACKTSRKRTYLLYFGYSYG